MEPSPLHRFLICHVQTIKDLEAWGYAHVLPLAKDGVTAGIVAVAAPSVGCAHSSFKLGISADIAMGSGQQPAKLDLFHNKWERGTSSRSVVLLNSD